MISKFTGLGLAELICLGFEARYGYMPPTSAVLFVHDGDELDEEDAKLVLELDAGSHFEDAAAAARRANPAGPTVEELLDTPMEDD